VPTQRSPANGDGDDPAAARLDAQRTADGSVRLVVVAPAAATVELAGDFTDWQPVQLHRNAEGTWETVRKIPSGVHRFNIRIDGSGWFAPAGTTRATDDFGGEVGIITVP